ncbi:MAG: hypothetical protein R2759_10915 [Bacteroidales bacterium]
MSLSMLLYQIIRRQFTTNSKGRYELEVPAAKSVYLAFSFIGYEKQVEEINSSAG